MTEKCVVCQGSKRIRLPLYLQLSAVGFMDADTIPECHESSREYACPECSKEEVVPYRRVGAVKARQMMDDLRMTPEHKSHWREATVRTLSLSLVDHLLKAGYIKAEDIPADAYHPGAVEVTLRAVAPADVASFDQRVVERQMEVAAEVAEEAKRLIDNWGSYYQHRGISKDNAHREIDAAVRNVRAKRAQA